MEMEILQGTLKDFNPALGSSLIDFGHKKEDIDLKFKMEIDKKESRRYAFLFDRAIVVCKVKYTTFRFQYTMYLNDFAFEEAIINKKNIAIKFTALKKGSNQEKFNCEIIFKSEAVKSNWMKALIECQVESDVGSQMIKPKDGCSGHKLEHMSFKNPTNCHHCSKLLYGYMLQVRWSCDDFFYLFLSSPWKFVSFYFRHNQSSKLNMFFFFFISRCAGI